MGATLPRSGLGITQNLLYEAASYSLTSFPTKTEDLSEDMGSEGCKLCSGRKRAARSEKLGL